MLCTVNVTKQLQERMKISKNRYEIISSEISKVQKSNLFQSWVKYRGEYQKKILNYLVGLLL